MRSSLPPHLIDVENGQGVLAGQGSQHLHPQLLFAQAEGGSREVNQQVGTAAGHLFHRIPVVATVLPKIAVVPNVFTNGKAQAAATVLDGLGLGSRLKIAIFVEDIVGGQERLLEPMADLAPLQPGSSIVKGPTLRQRIGLHGSHDHRNADL